MNGKTDQQRGSGESQPSPGDEHSPQSLFYYKDSGIQERAGRVPPWLWAVFVALVIWSIYYLVSFWTPPPS